ncbi:citrate synthase, mitochondrial precursor, putative [Plasmodium reichenowi]|uniref:Citrate synthase n=1 Tax=Plasmodium reichenowi TaxID=5854 RepID=A0A060RYW3_PLARE|nr:citrate synthase, mitochondrial precursor, putative [Plasmodium reichenowi]KYN97682.1 citrate synthase, mitochondrial precursor, putative [Plasmodium reichenowi]CDO64656.1 citrate synthase, mitochondrial precursor, putative [Plasmodium reichenowi]
MEGIRYLSCNKILHKRTGSTKTLINSLRKRYVHNNFKKKTCEQVLNTVNKLHNEKRYFNFSCSFTKSSRWNICMNRHNSRFFSSNESNKNLYLENYANIRKHINSIDNEESVIMNILKEKTYECIQKTREQLKEIIHTYPNTPISICTPNNVIGGLRNTITLITDTSILEKKKGILFRGKPVEKILKEFPKWDNTCEYPMAEAMLWFLLTKEVPAVDDLKLLSRELYCRAKKIPQFVFDFIDNIPPFTHPMSQLVSTVSFLESLSLFKYKYSEGILKTDYWKYILEDAISLISQIQVIGAYIFKRTFINNDIRKGEGMNLDLDLDWSANFAKLIGYENKEVQDLLRLYFLLHSDHEGGNASAHVSHLIGSTLGNPYLSYSGCVMALSGPLHGLANQECLKFLLDIKKQLGDNQLTYEFVEKYAKNLLKSGRVIPGYGHAVLRVPDPRFLALRSFALSHFPDDPIIQILEMCYKVIPGILSASGKVKNPYPNVDCSSGSVLHHYGIKYPEYYTVLFALSRSIGVMSQLVLSRGLMYPLERPKSVDIYNLRKICEKNYVKIEEYE